MWLKSVGKSIAKAAGNAIKSAATKALSNAASKAVSNAVSKNTGKSIGSTTSKAGSSASKIISSSANKWSSTTSKSAWKSLAPSLNKAASTISKLTSSVSNKASWWSSSSSGAKSTGKSISSVTSKWVKATNNLASSAKKSSWWGGGSSSSSVWQRMPTSSATSALTNAINKASGNANSSIYSDWGNTTIETKSDTNKLIPGTSIKSWGRTNLQTYDENGDLISDIDVSGKWYWAWDMNEELYVWYSDNDEDDYTWINPYDDVMNWAWDVYTMDQVNEMINSALDDYDRWNRDYYDSMYNQMQNLRNTESLKEEATPEKSETEKRLETPAFNQYSWNSEVSAPAEAAAPSTIPNPNDPLTDPTSYNEPITSAINKISDIIFAPETQSSVIENQAPEYNWDINQTLQSYNNAFNNIEAKGINRWTANEFANLYWKAKEDIDRYAEENWLSEEERLQLLNQLKNHSLVKNLNQNRWQWMR